LNFGAFFWFKNPHVFCAILRESSAAQKTKQNQRRRPTSHRKFEHEVRKSDPKFDPFGKTDKAIKQSNPQKFEGDEDAAKRRQESGDDLQKEFRIQNSRIQNAEVDFLRRL